METHMRHTQVQVANTRGPNDQFTVPLCSFCRANSRLVAIWKWVDPNATEKQVIQGIEVPNLLERRHRPRVHHTIAARRTRSDNARRRTNSQSSSNSSEIARRRAFRQSVQPGTRAPTTTQNTTTRPNTTSATAPAEAESGPATGQDSVGTIPVGVDPTPVGSESWEDIAGPTDTHSFGQFNTETPHSHDYGVHLPAVQKSYLQSTELASGKPGLLVDIGSIGNLTGDAWARSVSKACGRLGWKPTVTERTRPLRVHGVGTQPSEARHDVVLPIGIKKDDGESILGNVTMPVVPESGIPGLLGITSLRIKRALIDLIDNKLYFAGPGDYNLAAALPPGTECFQCENSPSGHLILPCTNYESTPSTKDPSLTLLASKTESAGKKDTKPNGGESKSSTE